MDFEDCVYNKTNDGKIMVGGYSLNSILSQYPLMISNTNVKAGDIQTGVNGFSKMFQDLSVPVGLLYLRQSFKPMNDKFKNLVKDIDVIPEDIYDNLINLVSKDSRRKHNSKTRKERKIKYKSSKNNTKTRKYK